VISVVKMIYIFHYQWLNKPQLIAVCFIEVVLEAYKNAFEVENQDKKCGDREYLST